MSSSLSLYDKTPLKEPIVVTENGQERKLRTIGDKWSYLQRVKFGSNTQPQYVGLDHNGQPITGSYSYKEDIPAYLDFLDKGLETFRKAATKIGSLIDETNVNPTRFLYKDDRTHIRFINCFKQTIYKRLFHSKIKAMFLVCNSSPFSIQKQSFYNLKAMLFNSTIFLIVFRTNSETL